MIEEYFDVVNENNEVIGQEVRRIVHNSDYFAEGCIFPSALIEL